MRCAELTHGPHTQMSPIGGDGRRACRALLGVCRLRAPTSRLMNHCGRGKRERASRTSRTRKLTPDPHVRVRLEGLHRSGANSITGIVRPAFAWNVPADGASATIVAKTASRSEASRIVAVAAKVPTPTSTVTHGSRSKLRNQARILCGAAVRCDDEIAIAASVVGERRRARLAAPRIDRCEQEERHVRELAAHDAAIRAEFVDHRLVETARIGLPFAHLTRARRYASVTRPPAAGSAATSSR